MFAPLILHHEERQAFDGIHAAPSKLAENPVGTNAIIPELGIEYLCSLAFHSQRQCIPRCPNRP